PLPPPPRPTLFPYTTLFRSQAGEQLLKTVLTRLRQHHLPASTADMAAAHLHAMVLAQLRGHTLPLRADWLDAIAGSLIKEALNADRKSTRLNSSHVSISYAV